MQQLRLLRRINAIVASCWNYFTIKIYCYLTRHFSVLPYILPHVSPSETLKVIIIIIILHGLGRLTCSGIDALPSFPGAGSIASSSRFVVEGVFKESGVDHSFKMVDPVLLVFESHVLYSRDL